MVNAINTKLNAKFTSFKVLTAKTQVVAGTNYQF